MKQPPHPFVIDFNPIPATAGIGLKPEHYNEILETSPKPLWFEVHTENYMSDGGPNHRYLEAIRADYPLSFHGVSLSIGSDQPLNMNILKRTKKLIERYQPALVSEHLSWSVLGDTYFNDLLPLPYTDETLRIVVDHINQAQDILKRQILIENPSTYMQYVNSTIPEYEFLAEAAKRTGCGLLVDVNNLYVNLQNHGVDAQEWLSKIPPKYVKEIHLAGHHINTIENQKILIDDHGSTVSTDVWKLYQFALGQFGTIPSLIEWDTRIPSFNVLLAQANKANKYLAEASQMEAVNA